MSSSSLSSPPTPRFRHDNPTDPLILPAPATSPRPRLWPRTRTLTICALLSLSLWLLFLFTPSATPPPLLPRPIDIDSVASINATILPGNTTWTISIPPGIAAPLRPAVYRAICSSAHEVSSALRGHGGHGGHMGYYWYDKAFIDPADTEDSPAEVEICDASLTYLLESTNAGFGVALMGLWSAYGLAKKEGRTFFVNDRDWAWGSYSDYFVIPKAKCAPPPAHWMLPCPHRARHLVVAPTTHGEVFGHAFMEEFEDPRKMGVFRLEGVFGLAREGYEGLFRMGVREGDLAAVEERKKRTPDPVVAVHVRRGDGRAVSWEFRESGYVPLGVYVDAVKSAGSGGGNVVYASDDPGVYSAGEFAGFEAAQGGVTEGAFVAGEFWRMSVEERVVVGRRYVRDLKTLGEMAGRKGCAVCGGGSVTCRLVAVVMGWDRAVVKGGWVNVDGGFDWHGVDW